MGKGGSSPSDSQADEGHYLLSYYESWAQTACPESCKGCNCQLWSGACQLLVSTDCLSPTWGQLPFTALLPKRNATDSHMGCYNCVERNPIQPTPPNGYFPGTHRHSLRQGPLHRPELEAGHCPLVRTQLLLGSTVWMTWILPLMLLPGHLWVY